MPSTDDPPQKQENRGLKRVSSLVSNSLNVTGPRSGAEGNHHDSSTLAGPSVGETVPDSEEERMFDKRPINLLNAAVIELSSDEEDEKENVDLFHLPSIGNNRLVGASPSKGPSTPRTDKLDGDQVPTRARDLATESKLLIKGSPKIQIIRSRRVVQTSSSECSDSDSEHSNVDDTPPERPVRTPVTTERKPVSVSTPAGLEAVQVQSTPSTSLSLYVDDSEPSEDDGAILILNEPKSARKPLRIPNPSGSHVVRRKETVPQGTPVKDDPAESESSASESDDDVPSTLIERIRTPSRATTSPTKQKVPRQTKAARTRAELKRREAYAQALFVELNRDVFDNGLPKGTALTWNKRLLTTAGRAQWHKNREGVETTSIELAVKILDCDERIQNTLSHEMCHLASWYINGQSNEGHGKVWKSWAARVMRKRPDIVISTKHNYEITYPYQWKCEKCDKIYGRFSKSIRPNECVCGACRIGKLIPQFTVRSRGTPKTMADSRLAADKPQDSPRSINRRVPVSTEGSTPAGSNTRLSTDPVVCLVDDSDDDEVEFLATVLGGGLSLID